MEKDKTKSKEIKKMKLAKSLSLTGLSVIIVVSSGSYSAKAGLINSSFEDPFLGNRRTLHFFNAEITQDAIPGWKTTDSHIEVWANEFGGVPSYEGTQHAEINAHINGSLFQELSGIAAGKRLGFEFAHRARVGTDVMKLTITDLGIDNLFATKDDTELFAKNYSATTENWLFHTSELEKPIFTLGNDMRFSYSAVSTGSGNNSVGNFLDAADFFVVDNKARIPEPSTILGLLVFGGVRILSSRKETEKRHN